MLMKDIIAYSYMFSGIAVIILSFLKGDAHFNYLREAGIREYRKDASFIEAFGPFSWNLFDQLLMLPLLPPKGLAINPEQTERYRRIKIMAVLLGILYLVLLSPVIVMIFDSLRTSGVEAN